MRPWQSPETCFSYLPAAPFLPGIENPPTPANELIAFRLDPGAGTATLAATPAG